MQIIGYLLSLVIGLNIGLLGGGGAILAVPVLVYLFGYAPEEATVYSLVIVAFSSLVSFLGKFKDNKFYPKVFYKFGIPSIILIFLTKYYVVPNLPLLIYFSNSVIISKNTLIMFVFSIMLYLSARNTLLAKENIESEIEHNSNSLLISIMQGSIIGFISGFIGAGGAFLIIPALRSFFGLSTKEAIYNSLLIIIFNSIMGVTGHLVAGFTLDWSFILIFSSISVIGVVIGNIFNKKIDGAKLKDIFGYLMIIISMFVLINDVLLKFKITQNVLIYLFHRVIK